MKSKKETADINRAGTEMISEDVRDVLRLHFEYTGFASDGENAVRPCRAG